MGRRHQGRLIYLVLVYLGVALYTTIHRFYTEEEEDEEIERDAVQGDDALERKFAHMSRKQIISYIAGRQ